MAKHFGEEEAHHSMNEMMRKKRVSSHWSVIPYPTPSADYSETELQ